jgi:hypothetical protein
MVSSLKVMFALLLIKHTEQERVPESGKVFSQCVWSLQNRTSWKSLHDFFDGGRRNLHWVTCFKGRFLQDVRATGDTKFRGYF